MGKGILKKFAAIVAGAAVFGGVSGGVFNYVVGDRVYNDTEAVSEVTEDEDNSTDTTEKTTEEDIPAASISQSGGVINTGSGLGVTQIVDETMPSVVAITIKSVQEYDAWFFGQPYQYESEGSGSGIIIGENESELLIVTNNHVVEGADSVTVAFIDGEAYEAKVKGTDADNDVAVIEVKLSDLSKETREVIKIAKIGDSDALRVGEQVVAIGNALGYGQSVTTGIVSAKDRSNSTNQTPLIQTDAAINPGNSGGALINMNGEIVGINSSKYADTDVEGMGYAIPIKAVETIIGDLSERETREDKVDADKVGYLGVETQTVDSNTATYYGLPVGAYINKVTPDSPAEKAGMKAKSVIVKFDGTAVSGSEGLVDLLQYYKAGETVEVVCKVLEGDEYEDKTFTVKLAKRKDYVSDDSDKTTESTTEDDFSEEPHGFFDDLPFDDMF